MTSQDRIDALFIPPTQWGLRGDPFLWNEIRDYFGANGIPDESEVFRNHIEKLFEKLTGEQLTAGTRVFVQRYDQGGMSSGVVDGDWWRNKGVPLLLERHSAT